MSYDMMIGIYDRFTMEHFSLCQSMILTSFFLLSTVNNYPVILNDCDFFS
jgi:hypothetical protein